LIWSVEAREGGGGPFPFLVRFRWEISYTSDGPECKNGTYSTEQQT